MITRLVRWQASLLLLCALPVRTARAQRVTASPPTSANHDKAADENQVTVRGARAEPGSVSMQRAEVRQLPGAFGDPFRAVDILPGVTPLVSGLPFFYMRGAHPGNVAYFVDGIRVPYLYHLALGPAVVHPALFDRVDVFQGTYPARYGRSVGGAVVGELAPPQKTARGEFGVRLLDAGGLVEAPWADGRGTVLVGGRYSYTGALISLLAPNVVLGYRDYQVRVTYDLSPRDRITFFSFGSYDLVGEKKQYNLPNYRESATNVLFGSEFYRAALRYEHAFTPDHVVRWSLIGGFDQTRIDADRVGKNVLASVRVDGTHRLSSRFQLRTGAEVWSESFAPDLLGHADTFDPDVRDLAALIPARRDQTAGVWVEAVWVPLARVQVHPGVRADLFRTGDQTEASVDPRVSVRFSLPGEHVHLVHAVGLNHQPPAFPIPLPGFQVGRWSGGLQQSLQASSGVSVDVDPATTASATVAQTIFWRLHDPFESSRDPTNDDGITSLLPSKRWLGAYTGLELSVHRRLTRRVGAYASYTLSRSTRSAGSLHRVGVFDRTHILNAAFTYNLNRGWRAGTRVLIYSGLPRFSTDEKTNPNEVPRSREPLFYRVDLRFERRWALARDAWVSFVGEILNATLTPEIIRGETFGPVTIPMVGVEGGF